MILLRISIPDLHFIHRKHSPDILDPLTPLKFIVSTARIQARTYVRTARQPDRRIFLLSHHIRSM